ncbi:hypothetical protein LCM20_16180 [Halobacillus litoralis]|uniref:hypothetical protein n=1 Tax=Halobacillus litoralis TaxID=45668 RepID=UPI001CD71E4C|nr:hypothetical protein [Halobacillus litoralis]MCA0972146.1 hypothetical protein [Halobacillus litoralis]
MKGWITLVLLSIVLFGCQLESEDSFVVYSDNMDNDILRESLVERLQHAELDYKVDDENNVLIKEKDLTRAVMCCS